MRTIPGSTPLYATRSPYPSRNYTQIARDCQPDVNTIITGRDMAQTKLPAFRMCKTIARRQLPVISRVEVIYPVVEYAIKKYAQTPRRKRA